MPLFAFSIAADQHRPSQGDGFVRAETIQQAVALVGHPDANVLAPTSALLSEAETAAQQTPERRFSPLSGIPTLAIWKITANLSNLWFIQHQL